MSDTIGRITIPTVTNSGQTFPLTTRYPFGFSVERPVIGYPSVTTRHPAAAKQASLTVPH
jgi:hypothetical protein